MFIFVGESGMFSLSLIQNIFFQVQITRTCSSGLPCSTWDRRGTSGNRAAVVGLGHHTPRKCCPEEHTCPISTVSGCMELREVHTTGKLPDVVHQMINQVKGFIGHLLGDCNGTCARPLQARPPIPETQAGRAKGRTCTLLRLSSRSTDD